MKLTPRFLTPPCALGLALALSFLAPAPARADAIDWDSVSVVDHAAYQAVKPGVNPGSYTSSFLATGGGSYPIRLVGVVLNNNEDWLDPTPAYDNYTYWRDSVPEHQAEDASHLFVMGGQAEIFVQAIDLDPTMYDTDTEHDFSDFGGTACWMGQNYGNHIWHRKPGYSYTDAQWTAELARLGLSDGTSTPTVRAGDLVEIRARIGLDYKGKMNVNENHTNDANEELDDDDNPIEVDWEIVVLAKNFVSDLKAISSEVTVAELLAPIDPSRATGGEHYQSSMITLTDVAFAGDAPAADGNQWTTVRDAADNEVRVYLGLNDSFAGQSLDGWFDITGILNQESGTGVGGYYLMVMNASDIAAVPEPSTWLLASLIVGLGLWHVRRK